MPVHISLQHEYGIEYIQQRSIFGESPITISIENPIYHDCIMAREKQPTFFLHGRKIGRSSFPRFHQMPVTEWQVRTLSKIKDPGQ